MNDFSMADTVKPKSDQWNADDFITGPKTFEIERLDGNGSNKEQPVNVFLKGYPLPYRPSLTMRRVMIAIWGDEKSNYIGKKLTLFCNPNIKFGGIACGGIQISHMSGIDKERTIVVTKSRAKYEPITIKPINEHPRQEVDMQSAQDAAREAANQGRESFNTWWKDNASLRDVVKPIIGELQAIVEEKESVVDA